MSYKECPNYYYIDRHTNSCNDCKEPEKCKGVTEACSECEGE